jgi:putative transferase (TIGR04331 family)
MSDKTRRYLIFSPDERLWKFNQPVVFLGNWCCSYKRKNVWSNMDFVIADPYGTPLQRNAHYASVRQLEDELFPILCDLLNSYHNTQYNSKFWKIVLGTWFQRYVDVIYNRVETLKVCFKNYNISGVTVHESIEYDLATIDSLSAIWSFNDDRWNSALFSRIFDIVGPLDFQIEVIHDDIEQDRFSKVEGNGYSISKNIFKKIPRIVNSLACYLSKKDNSFIINSFLPKSKELGLHYALGHIPKIWVNDKHIVNQNTDFFARISLAKKVDQYGDKGVRDVLRELLFELIPVCYLEGFSEVLNAAKLKKWPVKPKFIFTSSNYDTDEVFKLWAALKVIDGTEYIIGQHGNLSIIGSQTHRLLDAKIPDKFISWGWSDVKPQVIPAFIFKTAGKIIKRRNMSGGILLTLCHYPHRCSFWDGSANYIDTFENHKEFIRIMPIEYRRLLTIRFHSAWKDFNWHEKERLDMFNGQIKIEEGAVPIDKLLKGSRLIIHGYDSTGILETLSMNIPTLAFWNGGLDYLRDEAKPYYEILYNSGIIHFDPESISKKVQSVWSDVESWWRSEEVQLARKTFCDQYAKSCDTPITKLLNILD